MRPPLAASAATVATCFVFTGVTGAAPPTSQLVVKRVEVVYSGVTPVSINILGDNFGTTPGSVFLEMLPMV